ncbi:MAG TPA: triose-phosphate isomerase, partial [Cyclobacteriaceae bacterium]
MRSKIVAGNWKMNKTLGEAQSLTSEIMAMVADEIKSDTKIVLCVPFPFLLPV